jgi:homoserine dehydrogenase
VIRLGVLGCGHVGSAFVQQVDDHRRDIRARTGLDLQISRVAVHNLSRERSVVLAPGVLTHDASSFVADPEVDLVVELIGGIEPARSLVLEALKTGKPVVTANTELLAYVGAELYEAADGAGVDLLFEAAVGGAIPLVRPLRESLVGEPLRRVMGIVNGTTNYVLTRMTEAGADYHEALGEAQQRGSAERDPTADVEGFDAAAKAAILASIAFGARVVQGDVYREGIAEITPTEIAFAERLGYVVKLLAIVERVDDGDEQPELAVRVHPTMIPATHPLASVRESFNAVFVEGDAIDELMFYGRGAGGAPTASAVLGDVIDAAGNAGRGAAPNLGSLVTPRIRPIDELVSEYYLNLEVVDQPGVLSQVADVFGRHEVSIRAMEQEGLGDEARIIFITHLAVERHLQATLHDLRDLDVVKSVGSVLRVAGEEAGAG